MFTERELHYLKDHTIGRLASASADGRPHVVPVRFRLADGGRSLEIGARDLPVRGQRRAYRDNAAENPELAMVVDDYDEQGAPRGLLIRGTAKLHDMGGERVVRGGGPEWLELLPSSISSWGIESAGYAPAIRRAF
ncbi:pyridoxamine 5'-phosphate oxidase family protein [Nonomuraea sp. NPDC050790]|uniref:pyridoxamine 5'-phosphate oxidase family protein n=1 Tax=Nonomuraea sp. NPDC050790 TaxID=3364371 RepID=UPI00379249F9